MAIGRFREPSGETIPQLEEQVLRSWEERDVLAKVRERMRGGPPFVFCEGPPTANARPHIGHVFPRVAKDAFLRYHVMNGRRIVPYIAGWDCHGLPVELEVERSLGLRSKKDIESFGVDRFNQMCRESVLRYEQDWKWMSRRAGYWLDYEHAYRTMSREYIESVWWSLKQLHSRGLLQKGRRVEPYCPRCGTPLSSHEAALGFKEVESREVIVRMRVDELDAELLVSEPSPWRLPMNALVAVDRERRYVVFQRGGERLIVSEEALSKFSDEASVVARLSGADLLGKRYEPPFKLHDYGGRGFRVVHADGPLGADTGILSVAPATGAWDFELAGSYGVEIWDPVSIDGTFSAEVPELQGRQAADCDAEVMRMLESRGLLFKWELVRESTAPFCWRCGTRLLFKPVETWFVNVSTAKDELLSLNEEVRWVPDGFKHGRFGQFLRNVRDWAVSRSRYWGTPLPVWSCRNGHQVCVGSYEELRTLSATPLPDEFDPHRPFIDSVALRCPTCGEGMRREEFVIDCWYDSGCAPFAQYHYPFENIAEFDTHRSVDFIAEGVDQTRGWFYTQHALAALLFRAPAFKSVLVLGHVLDENGRKMNRLTGNAVYPADVFSSVGADATRVYLLGGQVWQPVQFSLDAVRRESVRPLTTLLNVYAFFASNANAYGFVEQAEYQRTHDLDRWIISRLHSTLKEAKAGFDSLEVHQAVAAFERFIEDLSNWYLRCSRRRFWNESDPQDRFSAHCTLYECLLTLSKAMAPVTPFLSEWLYGSLRGPKESVHLEDYPAPADGLVNPTLERQMAAVIAAVEAGRLARQKANVKLRQPLPSAVLVADADRAWTLRRYEKMVADELNVKRVECLESRERMIQYAVHPNLRVLGPKLKENASEVAKLLSKVDENELVKHLRSKGKVRLGGYDLTEEDVLVTEKEKPGYSHAEVQGIHAYVELEMTHKLRLEGLARDVIRRIQHMRKLQGLRFEDPIAVEYHGHRDIEMAVASYREHIMRETHAVSLSRCEPLAGGQDWTIDGLKVSLVVRKAG
ncbi:MAG: isoleucine--tRNA ligase [Thermoplasmata archaeon]